MSTQKKEIIHYSATQQLNVTYSLDQNKRKVATVRKGDSIIKFGRAFFHMIPLHCDMGNCFISTLSEFSHVYQDPENANEEFHKILKMKLKSPNYGKCPSEEHLIAYAETKNLCFTIISLDDKSKKTLNPQGTIMRYLLKKGTHYCALIPLEKLDKGKIRKENLSKGSIWYFNNDNPIQHQQTNIQLNDGMNRMRNTVVNNDYFTSDASKNLNFPHSTNYMGSNGIKERNHQQGMVDPKSDLFYQLVRTMESWESAPTKDLDSRSFTMEVIKLHQDLASTYKSTHPTIKEPCIINLVGDESSGKTTIATLLTHQVVLPIQENTATKARTRVRVCHRPDEPESITFKYLDHRYEATDPDKILKVMDKIFKDKEIDTDTEDDHIVEITIYTQVQTYGMTILDHPGFVKKHLTNTLTLSQDSVNKYLEGKKSILVVCHKSFTNISEAGWLKLNNMDKIPKENLVFVITNMDKLQKDNIFKRIRASQNCPIVEEAKYITKDGQVRYSMSPLDILEFIKWEIKKHKNLNDFTIFFVASSSLTFDDLCASDKMGNEASSAEKWKNFMKHPQQGQEANEKKALESLFNVVEWKQHSIDLVINKESKEKVLSMFGGNNLVQYLWRKQFQEAESLCQDCLALAEEIEKQARKQVLALKENKPNNQRSLSATISNCIKDITQHTHNLANPKAYSSSKEPFYKILQTIYNQIGYDLDEELAIVEKILSNIKFPPPDESVKNFNEFISKNKNQIKPTGKAKSLESFLIRLQQEIALRCIGVEINSNFLRSLMDSHQTPEEARLKVHEKATKVFNEHGSSFTSQRVALITLFHIEIVLKVLSKMDEYGLLELDKIDLKKFLSQYALTLGRRLVHDIPSNKLLHDQREMDFKKLKKQILKAQEKERHNRSPADDLCELIIAQYFDEISKKMKKRLDHQVDSISATPGYTTAFLHFAPLLIHQDCDHVLKEYAKKTEQTLFTQTFLSDKGPKPENKEKQQLQTKEDKNNEKSDEVEEIVLSDDEETEDDNIEENDDKSGNTKGKETKDKNHTEKFVSDNSSFKNIALETRKAVKNNYQLKTISREEQIDLQCTLIRLRVAPDILGPQEQFGASSNYEYNRVEFVVKRQLSAINKAVRYAIFIELDHYYRHFSSPLRIQESNKEMIERYVSLLLGYEYPYAAKSRPRKLSFLDVEHVAIFLKQNLAEFLKEKSEKKVHKREKLMKRSPLVRHAVSLLCSTDEKKKGQGKWLVETLYMHFVNDETEELNKTIIHALAKQRYANFDPKLIYHRKLQEAKNHAIQCIKATEAIKAFADFLKKHGGKIAGFGKLDEKTKTLKPKIEKRNLSEDEGSDDDMEDDVDD